MVETKQPRRDFGRIYRKAGSRFLWVRYRIGGKEYVESSHSEKPREAEKLLASVICTTVCAVSLGTSVMVCSGTAWFRCAGEPSRCPAKAETPGKPNRWQAWLEMLLSSSG